MLHWSPATTSFLRAPTDIPDGDLTPPTDILGGDTPPPADNHSGETSYLNVKIAVGIAGSITLVLSITMIVLKLRRKRIF